MIGMVGLAIFGIIKLMQNSVPYATTDMIQACPTCSVCPVITCPECKECAPEKVIEREVLMLCPECKCICKALGAWEEGKTVWWYQDNKTTGSTP
jgi:hypothetical protein